MDEVKMRLHEMKLEETRNAQLNKKVSEAENESERMTQHWKTRNKVKEES